MIYEEKTALLRKGFFEVQNQVGLGRNEEAYHKAMTLWLERENIPYVSKKPHAIDFLGKRAHTLYPDLIAWNQIVIELKAVPRHLENSERVQIFNYLKIRNDKLGLLVNMGSDRIQAERIIYAKPTYTVEENWKHWDGIIAGDERKIGLETRNLLNELYKEHSTGYGKEILDKLIRFGLQTQNIPYTSLPEGVSHFRGEPVGKSPLDCLVIKNRILLVFSALFETNRFNINRGISFMKCLNIPWGIAINFGKQKVESTALSL